MKHICTKIVAMLLVIAMIAGVLPFAFAANVGPFTDVKDTDWFASNVQYVYDNGLMNGTTTTTFEPESNLTRAQTAMVLWRIAGQPAPAAKAPFTDLVDAWYRDAIAWAAEQKVVNGRGDGTFDPAGFITREELVTMIWRYAGEAASEQDLSNWPDAANVYDYATGAMKWAVETGVINGKDGKLAPKDNATRAQFAAIIERYRKLNDTKADDIVILYTNDVHANITGGSSSAPTLTYEQVAWYRNNLQTPYSLLVDAGDAIQGEAISTLTHGEAIVEVMNAAGYDYATFGNHEFDYGMDQLLGTIVPAAKYQYLSCNFAKLDGTAIDGVKPYAIETFGSKKVALIGISTPESFVKSTPTYFQDKDGNYIYTFAEGNNGQDLYDSVQKTIDAAKKDGADYVVAIAHLGVDESSEPWRSTDVIANTTGLDAVLDGHSHSTIPQEIVKSKDGKDVVLSSTGTKLNNLGKLTISADGKIHSELISDREIEKDAKTKEVVDQIVAEFQTLLNKVVAHTDVDLTTQNPEGTARAIRNRETNLGDLCADAYRVTLGADIAIVNGGGIRADIPAGDITYNQIIKVHPYGNMACVVEATGQEILDALEMASRNTMADYVSESVDENGNTIYNAVGEMGGFLQVSGMKYTINTAVESTVKTDDKGSFVSVEGARRVQDVQVLNQTTNTYEPIDPAKTYTLASHNYMLKSGGDGINMFQDNKLVQDEVKIDNQVLIDYIVDSLGGNVGEQYKDLKGEGRITVINEAKPELKDNEYALSTELTDGAKVVFVNHSVSKAMSAANSEGSAYNRAGVDVTPVDGILTTDNSEIVWTVEKTEGGFFLKRADGAKLSIGNKAGGGTYNSMGFDQEDNPVWKIAPAATDGCIYLQSATATGSSGDPKSVEWYEQYSNFSMYYVSSSNEALFAMDMYVNTGAGEPAPVATVTAKVPSTLREGAEIPAYITTPKGYKESGSYPMVVMIHGHGGNHNEWGGFDKISNGLAEQGFVVATLDFPGCDASTESFQLNTMTNMKNDVLDVISYVCKNYAVDETRVGAFGYSMGGRITLELLAEGKYDFSTIELVAPAEDLADLKNLFGGAEKWEEMKTTANEQGYVEFTTVYGQHQELSKEWFADLEKYSDGLVEKAAENYTGDSLVIWATNDEAVSPSVSSAVATTLNAATLNTYADGHSYSFYGTTDYTVSTVNNGSVNYFVNELTKSESRIHGYVQSIAKYGNLELTIPGSALDAAGFEYGDLLKITVDGKEFSVPYGTNYSDVDQGSTILRNADGHLTLAINMGDFAGKNGIATKKTNEDKTYEWYYAAETNVPAVVTIEMGEKGGYYDEWLIHQLVRTNNREDYADLTDAEFANFRNVATTGMGTNALYRSSSPINPEIGRNTYADKAAEAAGVKTFMNLANDEATAKGYENFDSTYYSKQNVVYLNLGVDFTAADFKTGLATGLRYFTTHEGPYLVHCTEGKDRAGFVSALLECYMGATYDEVVADYMVTYYNYYGVTKEAEAAKYDAIVRSNIVKTLQTAFGVEDLKTADLKQEATDFFKELGLTESELSTLSENLGKPYGVETPKITVNAVTDIDKYGDMRLSITSGDFKKLGYDYADLVTVKFQDQELVLPVIPEYRYVAAKGAAIVVWKDDTKPVELEIFNGSFAGNYNLATKTKNDDGTWFWTANEGVTFPVEFQFAMSEKNGYRDEYAIFDLQRTNNREDYADLTDAQFANFRNVTTTGMGTNALYRSSSPVNPEIGRNTYADKAAEAAGVKTFMNLANDEATAKAYAGFDSTYYSKQNVIYLNLGVDFTTEQNRTGLAEGLRYFTTHEGPYLVHCNEGQDRAGFTAAVLECYMGATYDEVVADYMTTFSNYYGVKTGTEQYTVISNNIVKNLKTAFGVEDLAKADLKQEATDYFKELGLTDAELTKLTENLSKSYGGSQTSSYTVATSLSVGDKIIIAAAYNDKNYAVTNDTATVRNALCAKEITVKDNTVATSDTDIVWTVKAGSTEGTFVLESSDGKQMTYGGSGTSISLTDSGSDVTLTCGNGTASVAFSESRQLFMRDNNPAQFRVYSTSNLTSSGYCGVITFYKLG